MLEYGNFVLPVISLLLFGWKGAEMHVYVCVTILGYDMEYNCISGASYWQLWVSRLLLFGRQSFSYSSKCVAWKGKTTCALVIPQRHFILVSTYCSCKRMKNDDELLNQGLIALLECPVCMEYMGPPIHQCRRGHLVCAACKPKLPSCPTCRSRFTESRNLAMEKVCMNWNVSISLLSYIWVQLNLITQVDQMSGRISYLLFPFST